MTLSECPWHVACAVHAMGTVRIALATAVPRNRGGTMSRWDEAAPMFEHDRYFRLGHDVEGTSYVDAGDEVLVVPLTPRGEVVLIFEPSPAFGGQALVLPGGT